MSENTLITSQNTEPSNDAKQHEGLKKWATLIVLSLGLAIVIIDTTLLNVSLSSIIKDLHTNIQDLQWVITIYALVLTAFTITGGRFGDLFGRKKMFMLGAIIFAVGSLIASYSHSISILLLGESIIEGFGAALMMPATASLVVANFKGKERATAFGVWGAVAGASSAIGPLLGGYLTTHYSWRWGFRINVFVAAIVIIGSLLFIRESRDENKPTLDWMGVILSASGLLSIVFGIIESANYGWWKAKQIFELNGHQISLGGYSIVPIALLVGFILMALFFWWEIRMESQGRTPLVSMRVIKNPQFLSGSITVSILTLGMSGLIFALPIFLQSVKNLDAFHTGLALLPLSLALLVAAPLSGILSKKFPAKYLIQIGLLLTVIAMFILRAVIKSDLQVSHLIPGLLLYGFGMGMVMAPISNLTLSAVPVEQSGEASGINNTMRQLGSSLGAAIIGAAVLTSLVTNLNKGISESPVIPEGLKTSISQELAKPNTNIQFGGADAFTGRTPGSVTSEIQGLIKESSTQASRDAFIYAAMFLLLGLTASMFLPVTHISDDGHVYPETTENKTPRIAGAIILAAITIGGAVWLLHKSSTGKINSGITETAQDIQKLFAPPLQISTSTPDSNPIVNNNPAPAKKTVSAQNTKHTATNIKPRGNGATYGRVAGAATREPVASSYTNTRAGYAMQLTDQWQAQEPSQDQTVIVGSNGTQYSVQTYFNPPANLQDIAAELQGSPSVRTITWTTFLGEQAIHFTGTNGQGIAVIHNGKLYYIMGPQINNEPINNFRFL